jgi:uncharacterized protein YjbI with pentapeptide repeats
LAIISAQGQGLLGELFLSLTSEPIEGFNCNFDGKILKLASNNLSYLPNFSSLNLKGLVLHHNNLTSIDLTGCDVLEALSIGDNKLTEKPDVSECPKLTYLNLDRNPID